MVRFWWRLNYKAVLVTYVSSYLLTVYEMSAVPLNADHFAISHRTRIELIESASK